MHAVQKLRIPVIGERRWAEVRKTILGGSWRGEEGTIKKSKKKEEIALERGINRERYDE